MEIRKRSEEKMKNKVIKIITLIFIVLIITNIICAITNKTQALSDVTEDLEFWKPTTSNDTGKLTKKVNGIVGTVRTIGIIVSVASLSIIGIKYMLGSVEEKAQYKQTLLPWVIGAILVFAITTVPTIIYNMVSETNAGTGGSSGTNAGTEESSGTNAGTEGSSGQQKVHILLNASDLTLKLGEYEETTINAIVTGTNQKVKWESSNTQVATVDLTGKVTAKSKGTATITAYVDKATATCKVTVEAISTTSITISKDMVTLNAPITNSYELKATITPVTSKEPITWSSSNSNVVTVSKDGKVRAVGAGEAIITAKSGTKTDTCKVTVNSSRIYEDRYYNPDTKQVSTEKSSWNDLEFIMYMPDVSQVKNMDKLPMVIFLHGGVMSTGMVDPDNPNGDGKPLIQANPFRLHKENVNYPAVCIFPKNTANLKLGWGSATDEMLKKLEGLIDYTIENYNVDKDKVSLTGHSNGGTATWNIGLKFPERFSCLVTVCGYGYKDADVYPDCPVWAICSTQDGSEGFAERMKSLITATGGKVKYDNRGYISHNGMLKEAYTPELIKWMSERSRKTNSSFSFD